MFNHSLFNQENEIPLSKGLTFAGTFAVLSLMTGSVVEQLVPIPLALNSSSPEAAEFEAQRIGVASAVAFLSGIMMVNNICSI